MHQPSDEPTITKLLDLSGCCALVTGASGNIGCRIATRLAEAGADVILHYHSGRESAEATAAQIKANGGRAISLKADLTSEADVSDLFSELAERALLPDCVVNNAATQPVQALPDIALSDWQEIMAANLDSAFLVTQAAANSIAAAQSRRLGRQYRVDRRYRSRKWARPLRDDESRPDHVHPCLCSRVR